MTVEQKKALMMDRIQKLQNNKKDNSRIVQKLKRQVYKMS